jgi:ferredoxin
MLRCIFCGLCEEACPKQAIFLTKEIAPANYEREDFIYGKDKLVEGKSYQGGDLNEIGLAHIIYSGYFNNCLVKDVEPTIKFEEIVDWIETNLLNEDVMTQINSVI